MCFRKYLLIITYTTTPWDPGTVRYIAFEHGLRARAKCSKLGKSTSPTENFVINPFDRKKQSTMREHAGTFGQHCSTTPCEHGA